MPKDNSSEELDIDGIVKDRPNYRLNNVEIFIHNYDQLEEEVEEYIDEVLGEENYNIGEQKTAGVSPEKPLLEIKPEDRWVGIPLVGNETIKERLEENIRLDIKK